jgi:hypothetical protein
LSTSVWFFFGCVVLEVGEILAFSIRNANGLVDECTAAGFLFDPASKPNFRVRRGFVFSITGVACCFLVNPNLRGLYIKGLMHV